MSNPASLSSYSWPVGLKTLGRPPLSFGPLDLKCLVVLSAEAEAEQVNFLPARFASGSIHRQNSMQSERWKLGATFGVIFHQHAMPPWSVLLPDGVGRGCRCRFRFGASLACNTYGRSTTFGLDCTRDRRARMANRPSYRSCWPYCSRDACKVFRFIWIRFILPCWDGCHAVLSMGECVWVRRCVTLHRSTWSAVQRMRCSASFPARRPGGNKLPDTTLP